MLGVTTRWETWNYQGTFGNKDDKEVISTPELEEIVPGEKEEAPHALIGE